MVKKWKKSHIQCLNKIWIAFEFKMVWIKYQNMASWIAWNVWMIEPIQTMNDVWIKCEQTLKVVIMHGAWSKPQQRWCLNQPLNPTSIKYERQVKFNEIHQTKCF